MSSLFRFKQFSVDQTGCAMKINTDGVLLGAMANADNPLKILDIGTGTGVIALMLAQRFPNAQIDAVEIDEIAAKTASENFKNSPFADRLRVHPMGFEAFFEQNPDTKYDLIVSNPPFYINSLLSPKQAKSVAKHADGSFFTKLIAAVAVHLSAAGCCWLILPVQTAQLIREELNKALLNIAQQIDIKSFNSDDPHRELLCISLGKPVLTTRDFTIYESPNYYSETYRQLLQPFFLNF
jgi:tRNA1Val (adenine37-N6)-methyltransferase